MYLLGIWLVRNIPSGYMDRDGWLIIIKYFSNLAGSSVCNPLLFFSMAMIAIDIPMHFFETEKSFINTCLLKADNPENDQPKNNGPNDCFKECYNELKPIWDEHYGTTAFTPPHMNMVVASAWNMFIPKFAPITIRVFEKTRLHPLCPPLEASDHTASVACTASMKCSSGKKSKEL